ncbi:MAG TPA: MFS transporter [Dehalococcoidia bacterium]|nr:MFS transporter [Dehalococcoidia bacterium]
MDLLARVRDEMAFEGNVRKSYIYRFLMEFQLWWPIWVVYLQVQRGLSLTQITLLDTPFFFLMVLAEVPTGAIADRFGRRWSLMLGSSLFAVAVFVFAIADSYPVILLSYGAWGLGLTFQSGADVAMLYDSLKSAGREEDFQKINSRLTAVRSLAVLIAILIGAPIAEATSYSFPIMISAGIALLAVPVAFSMHEPAFERDDSHSRYLQTLVTGIRESWEQPALRYIILASAMLVAATFTPLVFQQPFLTHHHVGTGNLGLWQAPIRGAGVVSALLAYQFVSRVGERGAFFALPVMLGISNLALAGIDHAGMAAAFVGMGLVAGVQPPIIATYVNKRIPSERRATILSVQSVMGSAMLAMTQPIGGLIADNFGLRGVFLVFGVLTLTLPVITLVAWLRADAREMAELRALSRELLGTERAADAVPAAR